MNKCPRCENEKLVENQKFCQICGLKLDTSKEGAIASLKELHDNPLLLPSERQTIEYAITELERTAHEVPVQEQLNEIYPTTIEFYASLQSIIDNRMVTSDEAIKLNLQINSNMYDVNDVYRGIILIYQRLLECFR